jgi:hypothetical protein
LHRSLQTTPSALGQELSRDVSHSPAIQQEPMSQKIEPQPAHVTEIVRGYGLGMSCQDRLLSVHESPDFIEAAEALGAAGFVSKSQIDRDLMKTLHSVT